MRKVFESNCADRVDSADGSLYRKSCRCKVVYKFVAQQTNKIRRRTKSIGMNEIYMRHKQKVSRTAETTWKTIKQRVLWKKMCVAQLAISAQNMTISAARILKKAGRKRSEQPQWKRKTMKKFPKIFQRKAREKMKKDKSVPSDYSLLMCEDKINC